MQLDAALDRAVEAGDIEMQVKITECLRRFDSMNQADEHLAIRLASEQLNPTAKVVVVYDKPNKKESGE